MKTSIGWGNPLAAKRWSGQLFVDIVNQSYFDRKFVSTDDNAIIQRLTDLESDAGDTIQFDLSAQLRGKPTSGDNRLDGNEEALKFFSDEIKIDQLRKAVSAGGKMTRKRTVHNLRTTAKARLAEYWAKYTDEMNFIYLSGARGINEDFYEGLGYVGHATNPLHAPDGAHIIFGGSAESKNTLTVNDKMTRETIEKASVTAKMMRAVDPAASNMQPVLINGEGHYVCIMSPYQEYDMRNNDQGGWLEIQKAAAAAEGRNNQIFKGGLGMIDNVVLHSHSNTIRFNDYGSTGKVNAARALFLGRQAGVVAYGSSGGLRFTWAEEVKDYGNEPTVAAGFIYGVKKTRFNNNKDYGVIAIDTFARDPRKKS